MPESIQRDLVFTQLGALHHKCAETPRLSLGVKPREIINP